MNVREVLGKLRNIKRIREGWTARCRAHDDEHNSLSIKEGDGGRVLLYCHAGCSTEQVCVALGIGFKDLMPDPPASGDQPGIVQTYDYRDESGALLYQNCR